MKKIGFLTSILFVVLLVGCGKIPYEQVITSIEAGEKLNYNAVLKSDDSDVIIALQNGNVDTYTVGTYSVDYVLTKKNKKQNVNVAITVQDTTAPDIEVGTTEIDYGSEIDLLNNEFVKATDLIDENPIIEVKEGSVDTNVSGEYKVIYVAKDISNNISEKEVIFTVREKLYTFDEIEIWLRDKVENLKNKGIELPLKKDEDDGSLAITISETIEKSGYFASFGIDKEEPIIGECNGFIAIGYMTAIKDVYKDPYLYVISNGNKKIEYDEEDIFTSDVRYINAGWYMNSCAFWMDNYLIEKYDEKRINDLIEIFESPEVTYKSKSVDGDIEGCIPSDMCTKITEMLKLYKEFMHISGCDRIDPEMDY